MNVAGLRPRYVTESGSAGEKLAGNHPRIICMTSNVMRGNGDGNLLVKP